MTTLREAAQQALEAMELVTDLTNHDDEIYDAIDALKAALVEDAMQKFTDVNQELMAALAGPEVGGNLPPPLQERNFCSRCGKRTNDIHTCTPPSTEPQCNPHPKAPHGFLRNASHTEDRYVCECEYWEPYEAGYQAGMEAALRAQS